MLVTVGLVVFTIGSTSSISGAGTTLPVERAGAACVKVDTSVFSGTLTNVHFGSSTPFAIAVSSDGQSAAFTVTSPTDGSVKVSTVSVKGGSERNGGGYEHHTPNSTTGSGFTAPSNPNTAAEGDTFGVSHVIYCVSLVTTTTQPPTTTTRPPTTTTQPPTTTTRPSTTTQPPTTTTTIAEVLGEVVEPEDPTVGAPDPSTVDKPAPPEETLPTELAFTGSGVSPLWLALAGLGLMLTGVGLALGSKGRPIPARARQR